MELKDAVVIITGGSRGIGAATVQLLADAGARIGIGYYAHDEEAEEIEALAKDSGAETMLLKGDVADISASLKLVERVMQRWGRVDVLINNAGIISWKPLDEEKLRRLHKVLDVNVKGMVNMSYAVVKHMKEQDSGGVIINIASGAGKTGYANLAVYSASKFAVLGFTEALAKEVETDNVRVYAVSPGMTATDMTGGEGMPAEKVAKRIVAAALESLDLSPGDDTEIYG